MKKLWMQYRKPMMLLLILTASSLMTSCVWTNEKPNTSIAVEGICLIYSKESFTYSKHDTEITKLKQQDNWAKYKAVCPQKKTTD